MPRKSNSTFGPGTNFSPVGLGFSTTEGGRFFAGRSGLGDSKVGDLSVKGLLDDVTWPRAVDVLVRLDTLSVTGLDGGLEGLGITIVRLSACFTVGSRAGVLLESMGEPPSEPFLRADSSHEDLVGLHLF